MKAIIIYRKEREFDTYAEAAECANSLLTAEALPGEVQGSRREGETLIYRNERADGKGFNPAIEVRIERPEPVNLTPEQIEDARLKVAALTKEYGRLLNDEMFEEDLQKLQIIKEEQIGIYDKIKHYRTLLRKRG